MAEYTKSSNIDVFPAGFRDQDYSYARLTTETNLTNYIKISSDAKLNNYFFENPYDETKKSYILGLRGYQFIIKDINEIPNKKYVYIKRRSLTEGEEVLANITSDSSLLDLTENGYVYFQGLAFDNNVDSEAFASLKIRDDDGNIIQTKLKLGSSEIANENPNDTEPKSIKDKFFTDALNVGGYDYLPYTKLTVGTNYIQLNDGNDTVRLTLNGNLSLPQPPSSQVVLAGDVQGNIEWKNYSENDTVNSIVARNNNGEIKAKNLYITSNQSDRNIASIDTSTGKILNKFKVVSGTKTSAQDISNTSNRTYKIESLQDGSLVVNVPWEKGSSGGSSFILRPATKEQLGGIQVARVSGHAVSTVDNLDNGGAEHTNLGLQIDSNNKGFIVLPKGTEISLGGIKPARTTPTYISTIENTSGDKYGLQMDGSGKGFIVVPHTASSGSSGSSSDGRWDGMDLNLIDGSFYVSDGGFVADEDRCHFETSKNGLLLRSGDLRIVNASIKIYGSSLSDEEFNGLITKDGKIDVNDVLSHGRIKGQTIEAAQEFTTKVATIKSSVETPYIFNSSANTLKIINKSQANNANIEFGGSNYSGGNTGDRVAMYPNKSMISIRNLEILGPNGSSEANTAVIKMTQAGELFLNKIQGGSGNYLRLSSNGKIVKDVSDRRLKENIADFTLNNRYITDVPVKTFTIKNDPEAGTRIGFIAQDLQDIYPELVGEGSDGYLYINSPDLVYPLIAEVKELKEEIAELKKEIKALKKKSNKQS